MILPAQGKISQGFTLTHQAVDIANKLGTPVVAPFAGKVIFVGQKGSGKNDAGLVVEIQSGKYKTRLCHNSKTRVKVGQEVLEGQRVADMGYTGYTIPDNVPSASHCHAVLWVYGIRRDIRKFVTAPKPATPRPTPSIRIKPGVWRVRKGPNTVSGTRGLAVGGQKYELLGERFGWAKINFKGAEGWVGPAAYKK